MTQCCDSRPRVRVSVCVCLSADLRLLARCIKRSAQVQYNCNTRKKFLYCAALRLLQHDAHRHIVEKVSKRAPSGSIVVHFVLVLTPNVVLKFQEAYVCLHRYCHNSANLSVTIVHAIL